MAIVNLNNVTYKYPLSENAVLKNITLQLAEGEFVAIIGPNGAGKSTLCYTLSGFIPHFYKGDLQGTVEIAGIETHTSSLNQMVLKAGLAFQNPFNQITGAKYTVFEEIAFGLENIGVPRAEMQERVERIMSLTGISDLAQRSPYSLSGGQQQRVALTSILVMEPKVLVLDEPTSQLDPIGTRQVFQIIKTMTERGIAVVMAEHKIEWIAEFANRVIALCDGEILLQGTPQEVLTAPDLEQHGFGISRYTSAARAAQKLNLWPSGRRLPVTLQEAEAGFVSLGLRDAGKQSPGMAQAETASQSSLPSYLGTSAATFKGSLLGRVSVESAEQEDTAKQENPVLQESPAKQEISLEIKNLHYTYPGGVEALGGISITIRPGEQVAIVGQNGAGKTTLVKHLNGLLRPTQGEVLVGDWDTRRYAVSKLARRVGYVFQNPDEQLFCKTVHAEAVFGPHNLGYSPEKTEQLVEKALALTELTDKKDTNPYDLSPAWRKMVALASVIAMDTPVLIFDEPTTGQDAVNVERIARVIRSLREEGKTVITITHDIDFCAENFERIIAMAQGKVLLDGATDAVLAEDELLATTYVDPPQLTRLGKRLGLSATVRNQSEFLEGLFNHEGH